MKIKEILSKLSLLNDNGYLLVRYGGIGGELGIDDLVLEAVYNYESVEDEWEDAEIEFFNSTTNEWTPVELYDGSVRTEVEWR